MEYKGYRIDEFKMVYGNKETIEYEIKKDFENYSIIYYKNNGTTPKTATLGDGLWETIEKAKESIDNEELIKGGVFLTDKQGKIHWRTFKTIGKIWTCELCSKEYYDDKIKPYANTDKYGLLCKDCFNRIKDKTNYILQPKNYFIETKE